MHGQAYVPALSQANNSKLENAPEKTIAYLI